MNMSDLGTYIRTAIATKVNALLPSQSGNSGKYLTTNGASLSWNNPPVPTTSVNSSLTSLTIDCNLADVFTISINANATFTLSNLAVGKAVEIIVKNTSTNIITITLPISGVYRSQTYTIDAQLVRIFTVRLANNKNYWLVSEELSNA